MTTSIQTGTFSCKSPPQWCLSMCVSVTVSRHGQRSLALPVAHSLVETHATQFCAARSAWGSIFTWCRALMARVMSYKGDLTLQQREFFVRWISSLGHLMKTHLYDYAARVEEPYGDLWQSEVCYEICLGQCTRECMWRRHLMVCVRWISSLGHLMKTHLYDYAARVEEPYGNLWQSEVCYDQSSEHLRM